MSKTYCELKDLFYKSNQKLRNDEEELAYIYATIAIIGYMKMPKSKRRDKKIRSLERITKICLSKI